MRRLSLRTRLFTVWLRLWLRWNAVDPTDLEATRDAVEEFGTALPLASGVTVDPVEVAGRPAEWLRPTADAAGTVLYLHGGAYTTGSLDSHRTLATHLADASGCDVLHVAYRLAPEQPFPAAVEDATAAYDWLLERGIEQETLVVAGDSAGGGLAVATLLALQSRGRPLPTGAVLFSPWTDLSPEARWTVPARSDLVLSPLALRTAADRYLAGKNPTTPLASPTHADLQGLPPLFVQVGTAELLFEDVRAFASAAAAADVDVRLQAWPGLFHVWQLLAAYLPESRRALEHAGVFVRERIAGGGES